MQFTKQLIKSKSPANITWLKGGPHKNLFFCSNNTKNGPESRKNRISKTMEIHCL